MLGPRPSFASKSRSRAYSQRAAAARSDALVMGPTGFPDPADYPGYLSTVDQLYLDPLGFEGQSTALTTPETFDFDPSVAQGEQDLISAVTQQYDAGDFSAADPLTIFGYSQSAVVASLAEQQLADDGIPSDALRFVLIGDTSSAEGGFLNAFIGSLPTEDQSGAIEIADLLGPETCWAQPHPTTSTRPTSTPSPTTAGPIGRRTSTPA